MLLLDHWINPKDQPVTRANKFAFAFWGLLHRFRYFHTLKNMAFTISKWVNIKITWLVVWNMAGLFSISYMGCHPSQLSYFSRWLKLPTSHSLQLKIGHPIGQNPHINGLYYWTVWSSLLISTCFAILGSAKRNVAGVSCDFSSQTLWAHKRWIRIDAWWTY